MAHLSTLSSSSCMTPSGSSIQGSTLRKIGCLGFAVALIATAVVFHFQSINCIAVYSVGGVGGALILGVAIYSVVDWCKQQKEGKEGNRTASKETAEQQKIPEIEGKEEFVEGIEGKEGFVEGMGALEAKTSYVYIDVCVNRKGRQLSPGWYPLSYLSYLGGFSTDPNTPTPMQVAVEKQYGPFLFVSSFSNCHTTIPVSEPPISMPDPMPGQEGKSVRFPNVEFYFQYFKCALHAATLSKIEQAELHIRLTEQRENALFSDPNEAYQVGRQFILQGDALTQWDTIKKGVMCAAIYAKFSQHPHLGEKLKATASAPLVQLKTDPIWGPGFDGKGQNLLGVCLMDVRQALIDNRPIPPVTLVSGGI
jgi:ribA/ribD-fused uncharacterized protein